MSVINSCVSFTPTGGVAPYVLDISALLDTGWSASQIELSYCINGGTSLSIQTTLLTGTGSISGLPYNVVIPAVVAGDVVEIKARVTASTVAGDSETTTLSGSVSMVDAAGCTKVFTFNEVCSTLAAGLAPVCPAAVSIDCDTDLPFTLSGFANATSITATSNTSPSGYTFTPDIANQGIIIDGSGGNEVITVTASNGNPAEDCVTIVSIAGCINSSASLGPLPPVTCFSTGEPPFEPVVTTCLFYSPSVHGPWSPCGFSGFSMELESTPSLGQRFLNILGGGIASVTLSSTCSVPITISPGPISSSEFLTARSHVECPSGYTITVTCN